MILFLWFPFDPAIASSAGDDNDDKSKTALFFDKAALVMFDLPGENTKHIIQQIVHWQHFIVDFCFVSAFVLLLIVWAESIINSRRHWLVARSFHRQWLLCYVVFNIILYTCQVSLYSLLFVTAVNQVWHISHLLDKLFISFVFRKYWGIWFILRWRA
jgi:hypothetical protein